MPHPFDPFSRRLAVENPRNPSRDHLSVVAGEGTRAGEFPLRHDVLCASLTLVVLTVSRFCQGGGRAGHSKVSAADELVVARPRWLGTSYIFLCSLLSAACRLVAR